MAKRDFYEVLGVDRNADADALKKAYRKLAIQYHPDRQQGKSEAEKKEAEEKFKEAAEAYDVLSDPNKRARYDQLGPEGYDQMGGGGFSGGGMSMEDIFRQFGDLFGGFGGFGGFSGFGDSGHGQSVNYGTNLRVRVKVTLQDVAKGTEKKIKIPRQVSCSSCNGTGAKNGTALETCSNCRGSGVEVRIRRTILGQMQTQSACSACGGSGKRIVERCPNCGGKGLVKKEEVVNISIPAGVKEGMMLTMRGKGNDAPGGGVPGDLQIVIEEQQDKHLIRNDQDLIYNLMIDFPTAALGGKVEIPTINGRARVTIEPGTQPGKILRLRGKGLPSINGYGNGDLLVNIMVYVPENLNASDKRAVEALRDSQAFTPSSSTKERIFSRLRHMFD